MKKRRLKGGRNTWAHRPKSVGKKSRASNRSSMAPHAPSEGVERVLGLDFSSVCCGWAIFDNGQLLTYGKYHQQGDGHGERMWNFHQWLLAMLEAWSPNELVYEAPYAGPRRHAFSVLSRYAGTVQLTHYAWKGADIPEENAVAANMVKKLIGAKKGKNHEANKKIVLLMINQRYGLGLKFKSKDPKKTISQDDEADAIAVCWAWHERNRMGPIEEGADDEA